MLCLGILCRHELLEGTRRCFINERLLKRFSSLPVMLHPIVDGAQGDAQAALCDALLLPGGIDALPCYYAREADSFSDYYDGFADLEEFLLIQAFLKAHRPILGICRGMQLLQLYFHGALESHFDQFAHHQEHRHPLCFAAHTYLKELYTSAPAVNSHHHQRIRQAPSQFQVDAYCEDGTIEAFHHRTLPIYGVQWHPEMEADDRILPYFLSIAAGIITPFHPTDESPKQHSDT